ncbi:MAG: hypothetical protein JSV14_13295 [Deltaproteobacteria bacterium]|nr:MAG: hypothetical protein JSV14_13295 [Deltaproteobacteria bacterium]
MFVKQFFRKFPCILLVLGIIVVVGGIVQGAEKDKDTKEKTYALTEAQLQSHLMSFADRFASLLDTAIAKFENLNPSGKSRYEVLELMTFSLHHAFIIAGESDPDIALLDMFSMVTLGRIFFEEEGQSRYGKTIVPVIDGYSRAEADIRNVAAKVLTPDQMLNLITIIKRWRTENPEVKSFPLIRFSNFAADRRESTLSKAEEPEGLFESVESASETVEEMRLLAERGAYLATRIPQLFGLFGDLWLTRWIDNPDLQKALTDLSQLSQGTFGLAAIAENMPDQIATEREATIKQLMGEVSTARKAAMADFLAEFQRIEERLIPEIANAMDRAESEGEELVDHTMRQVIILIVIWWIGYIIARVIVQVISKKSSANRV